MSQEITRQTCIWRTRLMSLQCGAQALEDDTVCRRHNRAVLKRMHDTGALRTARSVLMLIGIVGVLLFIAAILKG